MGYFAVISDGDEAAFRVSECHINFWSLGGLGHRVFQFDVGLRLIASKPFSLVKMVIPLGTNPNGWHDLAEVIRTPSISELIFGGPAPATVANVLKAERDEALSGKAYSFWTLRLASEVQTEAYVRVRFDVVDRGREWIWKRVGLATSGAIVDLRVAETREAVNVEAWQALKNKIVPIEELNLFVMAPSTLQLKVTSPIPRYIRLLEGRAWGSYIGRAPDLFRTGKLIVYYWRHKSTEDVPPIDVDNPFRAFLDLDKQDLLTTFGNRTQALLLVFATVLFAGLLGPHTGDIARSIVDLPMRVIIATAGVLGVGTLATSVIRLQSGARAAAWSVLSHVESVLFRP